MKQLFIFIVHTEEIYKIMSKRKKEPLKGVIKQTLLQNTKIY